MGNQGKIIITGKQITLGAISQSYQWEVSFKKLDSVVEQVISNPTLHKIKVTKNNRDYHFIIKSRTKDKQEHSFTIQSNSEIINNGKYIAINKIISETL